MFELKFSENQARFVAPAWNPWLKVYFQNRYGRGWIYYWMNWEANHEVML